MPYCQYCNKRIDEDLVFCPRCGGVLVEKDAESQDFELEGQVEEAKDRSNMYVVLAVVLVTVGMIGASVLFVSSSLLGLFGIVFVCLGIGCTAAAYRYEHKARTLRNQLSRCN
jgi:protein-S-isoprenylcysteine O-methyltransferase Ste14